MINAFLGLFLLMENNLILEKQDGEMCFPLKFLKVFTAYFILFLFLMITGYWGQPFLYFYKLKIQDQM